MTAEENKALYRRAIEEVFNAHDLAAADQFVAPDLIDHSAFPGQGPGREGWRQARATLFTAFPDLHITVEDQIAEGDQVVNRWTLRGTQHGEFMGMSAAGKPITMTGIDIVRIANATMIEHRSQADMLGLLQQLGVMPAPRQALASAG